MRVVIVDDHPVVRRGMAAVLGQLEAFEVVGEASNGKEAIMKIADTQPDLAIIDLILGMESGLDLIAKVRQQGACCQFIALTATPDKESFKKAKELGVSSYISKEALPEELVHALQMIGKGRTYYDSRILEQMVGVPTERVSMINVLTPKETEVLIELGKGLSNKEISQMLYITEYTVKKHVSQVLGKLNLADRTQAALFANATGLVRYVVN
ncbi:DNA-binding response regulator [Sporosarcina sp. NCCP-2222]|uniref:response regulator transcription factor n=1 Tax=Sporosarcina sp. NCCP-2222 TaxID=2935073 RepID=UPI0020832BF2|nr:response regulator transcription factor [Sporosarcina sp. NCCP-2222]GKV57380.1 DNA-binding response regulator [Sporosarcina sp. NCCP-2222]